MNNVTIICMITILVIVREFGIFSTRTVTFSPSPDLSGDIERWFSKMQIQPEFFITPGPVFATDKGLYHLCMALFYHKAEMLSICKRLFYCRCCRFCPAPEQRNFSHP